MARPTRELGRRPLGRFLVLSVLAAALAGCSQSPAPREPAGPAYDVVIRGGTVYDGRGGAPFVGDVAVRGDRIAAVGDLAGARARREIDATGLAVSPGFVNMLSWATESLIEDGRGMSDLLQGITLEVFGEGWSMGPVNDDLREVLRQRQSDIRYDVEWDTLGGYLDLLAERGISPNVASFVGATTVRAYVLGFEDRPPTPAELDRMRGLVREAMEEGALGVGSSLIYAPAFYASTDELVALAEEAGEHGGMYISHLRSEGNRLLEAVDELIEIARRAGVPAEIYHLKAAGRDNWGKLDDVIARVERARAAGLRISADMYTYTAGATGLDAAMPPWVQEGGLEAWVERLRDPEVRSRVRGEMRTPTDAWENLFLAAGPEQMVLLDFKNPRLRHLQGRTLAEVAAERGFDPAELAMDLVIEDGSRVGVAYFLMSEDNVRRKAALPWVSFGSDAGAPAAEGVFVRTSTHPRAYGNVARLLGRYVRDEGIVSLAEAVRRLSGLPAANLGLRERGLLQPGYFADVVVFDPATVVDHATFEEPHRYATGVVHVLVNGEPVVEGGAHTGALPGRVVRGPGWTGGR
jgi:N-acyl-D-amino-acid deacylase